MKERTKFRLEILRIIWKEIKYLFKAKVSYGEKIS